MKIFFFDTETTGLPKNYKESASNDDNWPRLVQVAWEMWEDDKLISQQFAIIKPEGFMISLNVSKIHGITTEIAVEKGAVLVNVLNALELDIKLAELVVGHNISFDIGVLGSEFLRMCYTNPLNGKILYCTKEKSANICKIPGNYGKYKWPNLAELYFYLFKKDFNGAHNAINDVRACRECYFEMRRLYNG